MEAACRPVAIPSPSASKPYRPTAGSSMKSANMPMAFEPPPTQAATA
jgi:hypothetical protein